MDKKILIIEDEKKLNKLISDYLSSVGFKTISAYDGLSGIRLMEKHWPDLIVLDIMLPAVDGIDITRRIREYSDIPIIIVTAKTAESDKLIGLETGADDYMTKPFSMKELAARIRAVLRRGESRNSQKNEIIIKDQDIVMDTEKRTVSRDGKNIELTSVQFEILKKMMLQPGRVFTRMELLNTFQSEAFEGYERTIDVHIKNIRKALERNPSKPEYVQTVWGVGYKMVDKNQE
jgi:DNA-binding response OmpR family regulator